MADTIRTTHDSTANTTTTTGTKAGYDAEAVRVGAATKMEKRDDKSASKGLIVGVLTFLVLSLWEWLDGPTGAAGDAITFPEMAIYAVVGIVVGLIVKAIDKSRQKKAHH